MISFLVCTNMAPPSLDKTLASISQQDRTVPFEVLLINNGFDCPVEERITRMAIDLHLDGNLTILREARAGLGFARKCAFEHAKYDWLILLDDDNTLEAGFLTALAAVIENHSRIGGVTAMISPVWELQPRSWVNEVGHLCLSYNAPNAFLDVPSFRLYDSSQFAAAPRPPGGGMIIHRDVAQHYLLQAGEGERLKLERTGSSLVGCQDEDIWRGIRELGLSVIASDRLKINHHIPASRTRLFYLFRLNYQMTYSYVLLDRVRGELQSESPLRLAKRFARATVSALRAFMHAPTSVTVYVQLIFLVRELGVIHGHLRRDMIE